MPKEASGKTKVRHLVSILFYSQLDVNKYQRKAAEKAEKATTRTKASSSKKDPKAPKRALSAYMFFSQDWRERIKTENPDAGFGA